MTNITVSKFGGTSVADYESMVRSKGIVSKIQSNHIVVVSATSGTTNILEKLSKGYYKTDVKIHKVCTELVNKHRAIISQFSTSSELKTAVDHLEGMLVLNATQQRQHNRESRAHAILATGEDLSAIIFTELLNSSGLKAIFQDSRNLIRTNEEGRPNLLVTKVHTNHHLKAVIGGNIIVTQGFVGSDSECSTTTLGRGGSDYSAALIAEAMSATRLNIWTDVLGVYDKDPNTNFDAILYGDLSYSAANILANSGAKVLHPKTIEPAQRSNTPIYVGSSFQPDFYGTLISA
jgi:aspartate kinase